tara:strand:- start:12096 stop:12386 length:291 start_codon:yes stop_codon:yes gene_type:complete
MSNTEKPKEYNINSFDKLLNVINEENFDILSIDLIQWLGLYVETLKEVRKKHPELKDRLNSEIAKGSFIWIDDGKNDMKDIFLELKGTGEIIKIDV